MAAWFEALVGAEYGLAAMWTTVLLILALLVLITVWLVRRAMSGTFVVRGRGRRPRLAVLDAAAIDSRRRLVLIRRDDVEHLIMIGGPTDVVVERNIQLVETASVADFEQSDTPATRPERHEAAPVPVRPRRETEEPTPVATPITRSVEAAAPGLVAAAALVAEPAVGDRHGTDKPADGGQDPRDVEPRFDEPTTGEAPNDDADDRLSGPIAEPQAADETTRPSADSDDELDSALIEDLKSKLDHQRKKRDADQSTIEDDIMAKLVGETGEERV